MTYFICKQKPNFSGFFHETFEEVHTSLCIFLVEIIWLFGPLCRERLKLFTDLYFSRLVVIDGGLNK